MEIWRNLEGSRVKTADALIKTGAGFIQSVTFAPNDATPTAGTISIRDGVAAGGGTELFGWVLPAAYFVPFTITLEQNFTTGLFIDFTTTADVNVIVNYK